MKQNPHPREQCNASENGFTHFYGPTFVVGFSVSLPRRSSSHFRRIARVFLWLLRSPPPFFWLGALPGRRIGWSRGGGAVRAAGHAHEFRTAGGLHNLLPYLADLQLQAHLAGKSVRVASLKGSCGLSYNRKTCTDYYKL